MQLKGFQSDQSDNADWQDGNECLMRPCARWREDAALERRFVCRISLSVNRRSPGGQASVACALFWGRDACSSAFAAVVRAFILMLSF